ncbi:MAG: FAD-binding protein [Coriobacteriales bacterium]|jgi:fumarate reductase flavoprotein subunit|nr:FAD-binding protein [Coriobacteriales bacterium]
MGDRQNRNLGYGCGNGCGEEHGIDRRAFMKGTLALGAAGALGLGLAACTNEEQGSGDDTADEPENTTQNTTPARIDEVLECDVAVVGCGVAGISACVRATDLGARVIGMDRALSVAGTNAVSTVGFYGIANKEELPIQYKQLTEKSNYMLNITFLSRYLGIIEDLAANYLARGMTIMTQTAYPTEENPGDFGVGSVIFTTGHFFVNREGDRAAEYEGLLESCDGLDQMWRTEVTGLIVNDGVISGCYAQDSDGRVYQINAKGGVIVCTGGFVHNAEMVSQYIGNTTVYSYANLFNDGAGIKLAQSTGAQLGKNFALNCSEGGGLNHKSREFNTYLFGTNSISRSPIIGDVILNRRGQRFVDEGVMSKKTAMFCSEPLTREGGAFYTVMSQKEIDTLKTTTLFDYVLQRYGFAFTHPMILMFFAQDALPNIQEDAETAITEGWCWKADSFEALEQVSGLANLAATMQEYNGMCAAGVDTILYKDEDFLVPYLEEDGPFYLVEHDFSAWSTQGGIKTDAYCRALDGDSQVIPGLYMAGMDADNNMVPYLFGGTAQGFALGSGYLAAEDAVKRVLG